MRPTSYEAICTVWTLNGGPQQSPALMYDDLSTLTCNSPPGCLGVLPVLTPCLAINQTLPHGLWLMKPHDADLLECQYVQPIR